MHTFVVAQVGKAVLQKTVAGIVQDALRLLLQQLKGVERRGVHVVSGSDDSTMQENKLQNKAVCHHSLRM